MRLGTRVRIGVLVSVATVASLGAFAVASLRRAERARERAALGVALQQVNLERAVLRDQYLLSGDPGARGRWEVRTAWFEALLAHAATRLDGPDERELLRRIREETRRSEDLFRELVRLAEGPADPASAAARAALREQLWSALLISQHVKTSELGLLTGQGTDASGAPAPGERRVVAVVFAVFAVALALLATEGVLTLRSVKRRLTRLQQGAERIASGQFAHRIAMTGEDELADLGRAFDAMAESLQEHVDHLEASNRRLAAANRELESFSYSVSHDLRAPLRHIAGFVGILQEEVPTLDEGARRALTVIADSARKMGLLIDDLLAFSRLGRTVMHSDPVELALLAESVVAEVRRDAQGRDVVWEVGPLPAALGDAAMLRQAFLNLVGNALKFTRGRQPARIEIGAVRAEPGRITCFVRDNGVGFDMRYADKLFGVFQRLHGEREFEGTGVGLAIVQRIVHRHGGRVWAEAKPGEGATFWVSLPAARPAAAGEAAPGQPAATVAAPAPGTPPPRSAA